MSIVSVLYSESETVQEKFLDPGFYTSPRGENLVRIYFTTPYTKVVFSVADIWSHEVVADDRGEAKLTLDTALFLPGHYVLEARTAQGTDRHDFKVGPRLHKEGIPLNRWGHVNELMDLSWYQQRGFTGGTTWVMVDPEERGSQAWKRRVAMLDKAAKEGFSIGFYLHPLWSRKLIEDERARVWREDGVAVSESVAWPVNALSPLAGAHADAVVESFLENYADHPAIQYVMLSSEQRPLPGVNPETLEMADLELPFAFCEILRPKSAAFRQTPIIEGLIPNDHPDYLGRKWFFERGHGTALLNQRMAERIRQTHPHLVFSHEPWRLAPTRDVAKGLDMVGSWTYSYSDLRRLMFGHFLRAPGRHENQGVQAILTIYAYARMVMTLENSSADLGNDSVGKDPSFTADPDFVRAALWIYLSLRPEEITVYWASLLSPDLTKEDPFYSAPESFEVFKEFAETVLRPYSPAILNSQREKASVALLASAAGAWFSEHKWNPYNPNERALPFASLLAMNDVPFDVLLDDDIVDGGLQDYQMLILPCPDTMTEQMAEQIEAFIERGGKVIANQSTPLRSWNLDYVDFDFEVFQRQDGQIASKGKELLTAEESRAIMKSYAEQLAPLVRNVKGTTTSDSPWVIINSLSAGQGRYDFIINDHRDYGSRFGKHRLYMEKGIEQKTKVTLDTQKYPVLYDVSARAWLDYKQRVRNQAELEMTLPPAAAKLILALPEKIGALQAVVPETIKRGEHSAIKIKVVGESGKVMQHAHPLQINILNAKGEHSGWSGYFATAHGEAVVEFTPACNDEIGPWTIQITDLVSGIKQTLVTTLQ